MAHLLGDVAQPMHTDGRLAAEDRVHATYEHAVDERCSPSQCQFAVVNDGVDRVRSYAATVALARAAHPLYGKLIRRFNAHGYTGRVHGMSGRQINRASNVLADLIRQLGR